MHGMYYYLRVITLSLAPKYNQSMHAKLLVPINAPPPHLVLTPKMF